MHPLSARLGPPLLGTAVLTVVFSQAAAGSWTEGRALERLAVAVVGTSVIAATVARRLHWTGPGLVLISALVPFHVSFVGKTPFGVVTTVGAVTALILVALVLFHPAAVSDVLRGREVQMMMLWVGVLIASSLSAGDLRLTLDRTRVVAVAVLGAYVIGRVVAAKDRDAPARVAVAVGVICVVAVLEGLIGISPYELVPASGFPLEPPPEATRAGLVRVRVGYFHASVLGTLLAVTPAVIVTRAKWAGRPRLPWVPVVATAALILTLTSQAWAASAAALAVLAVGLKRARVGLALAAVAGAAILAVGVLPAANELVQARLAPTGSYEDQAQYRLALLPAAWDQALSGPVLGSGPGSFNRLGLTAEIDNATVVLVDDSTYAAVLVETGLVGLAALLVVVVAVAVRLRTRAPRWVAWAGLSALTGWLVMGLSVDLLASDQVLAPVWFVIGLLSGARPPVDPRDTELDHGAAREARDSRVEVT